jgi:hypothetical protein
MPIVVTEKVFELPDEGVHNVVISEVVDLGLVETKFGTKDRVRIVFEVTDQNDSEGNPLKLFVSANKVLSPKSTLGILLNDLGVVVSGDFDLEDLVGIKAIGVVKHTVGENKKTYANIVSYLKPKKAGKFVAEDSDIPF